MVTPHAAASDPPPADAAPHAAASDPPPADAAPHAVASDPPPGGAEPIHVLVVDDNPDFHYLLQQGLERAGYTVMSAFSGPEALAAFVDREPEVVLLDILMPGMDGYELCRRLRELSDVPIIMVSALRNEPEIVQGLDAGADDYVTKPFLLGELTARIRAHVRRLSRSSRTSSAARRVSLDDGRLQVDLDSRQVSVDGRVIRLGPTEFRLLSYLAINAERIVPHQELVEQVWGSESAHLERYLRIYVQRLRRKMEWSQETPRYLVSAHGVGYGLVGEGEPAGASPPASPTESAEDATV